MSQKNQNRAMIALALCVALCLAALMGAGVLALNITRTHSVSRPITQAEIDELDRYARLNEVYEMITNDYYIDVDADQLILGAIDGMTASLNDPYTYYQTPEDVEEEQTYEEGVYYGIGVQLLAGSDDKLYVTRAYANSPARKAGIRSGDIVTAIAGETLTGSSAEQLNRAVDMIRGEQYTGVDVTVLRGGEELTFNVTRDTVTINRVEYSVLEGNIGYIAIYEFMGDDVAGFNEALDALLKQKVSALVIDLRDNPGGLLGDVLDIADRLLDEGLVVYMENRHGERQSFYSEKGGVDLPMAVLVNGFSASASEVLTGALQDYGVAEVVGETTFGKGIVQTITTFGGDGAGLHMTTESYYTPNGRSIHGTGIEPDVVIAPEEDDEINAEQPDPAKDAQLRKVVELLTEKIEK